MKYWSVRLVLLLVLALLLSVPFLLAPKPERQTATARSRLVIVTPHDEQIRFEIAGAFNRWREEQKLSQVEFDWRSWGGTSDLRKGVLAEFLKKARQGREDEGIGYDLFFGGGDFEHDQLAHGVTVSRQGQDIAVAVTVPVRISPAQLREIYPTPDIGGARLYHPQRLWMGVVLSSFGIVYNRDVLQAIGVTPPQTWGDLADPRYLGSVALADPLHSGSSAVTYETILRRAGWTEGWALLRRVFANARYCTASASKVPVDVSAGEAAAGMCIDFYGRFQAGAIGENRLGYVDPPYMTAVTADPISILRGAPSQRWAAEQGQAFSAGLANQFVLWLLSKPAQRIWQERVGLADGPVQYALHRSPIRRDLYVLEEMKKWTDPVNLYALAQPIPEGMPGFYYAVAPVAHALAIDNHDDLRAAWEAIQRWPASQNDPRKMEMLRLFDAMPTELTLTWPDAELAAHWREILEHKEHSRRAEVVGVLRAFVRRLDERYKGWKDNDRLLEDRLRWTGFFRANYRRIMALAREKN